LLGGLWGDCSPRRPRRLAGTLPRRSALTRSAASEDNGSVPYRPAALAGFLALVGIATIHGSSASAALIAVDLLTAGDGLITRDSETGLNWLDLTATVNRSYSDIEADVGGWISLGFRHATGSEVCGLFTVHALAPSPCPNATSANGSGNVVATLQGFVGITNSGVRVVGSHGMFDDGDASNTVGWAFVQYSVFSTSSQSAVLDDGAFADTAGGTIGHWLVHPVPEPSTALLLAAGLVALAGSRRRLH
jgi:hypothetical protein